MLWWVSEGFVELERGDVKLERKCKDVEEILEITTGIIYFKS